MHTLKYIFAFLMLVWSSDMQAQLSVSGQVQNMAAGQAVSVQLIKVNGGNYVPTDYIISTDGNYSFTDVAEGNYILQAIPNCFAASNTKLPRYFYNKLEWQSGNALYVNSILSAVNWDLEDYTHYAPTGNGTIAGHMYTEFGELYSTLVQGQKWFSIPNDGQYFIGGTPARNLPVFLEDDMGDIVGYTLTDSAGFYVFENLPNGNYNARIEVAGVNNGSLGSFTINGATSYELSHAFNSTSVYYYTPGISTDIERPVHEAKLFYRSTEQSLHIELPNNATYGTLQIYNLTGKNVLSLVLLEQTVDVPLSQLPNGLYIGQLQSDNQTQSVKFLKQ